MPIQGALAYEEVAVEGTAIGIASVGDNMQAGAAFITVEDAQISFNVDGSTPTSTAGHLANPGDVIELTDGGEVRQFLAIRTGGVSATIKSTLGAQYIP